MIIPLSQLITAVPEESKLVVRDIPLIVPPPPKTPPPKESTQKEPPPMPEFQLPPEAQLETSPLDIAIKPQMGDVLNTEVKVVFATQVDISEEIEKIFTFEELQQPPRPIFVPPSADKFPNSLRRVSQVTVVMIIQIDKTGKVSKVERIKSATHPGVEIIARRYVKGIRFTPPMVDGRPVKVRGVVPLTIPNPRFVK